MTRKARQHIADYLRELSWPRLLRVVFTLISFVGILSPFFKVTVLTMYLLGVGAAWLILTILYLSFGQTRQRVKSKRDHEMITRYTAEISARAASFWSVERVQKVLTIDSNGDCKEYWTISGKATGQDLGFYRFRTSPGKDQTVRQRRKIQVKARTPIRGDEGGIPYHVTTAWRDENALETLVHFPSPIKVGEEFMIVAEIHWPAKCRPLVRDKETEKFSLCFANIVGQIDYTVVLPPDTVAHYEPLGFRTGDNDMTLTPGTNTVGQRKINLIAKNVPENKTVGMYIKMQ
ncbi:hypothetical protein H4696_008039 [Amycolatopsis lexingtonensis]|uniref:Uncharacterized protein n=1 Tax=Amycolatopsis lexingtonensis TaxID=218822 RepID=A0ABR9ICQ0_9PSEU|nr:hypothetical protein [Amycolatopsis lexingtonensis]MBE1500939.1 hypothetical protein [Amycolatopsis lexingtonensis]